MKLINKKALLASTIITVFLSISSASFAANSEDTYTSGFATYAKDNPEWASSIENYLKDLKKVMKENPSLDDSKTQEADSE